MTFEIEFSIVITSAKEIVFQVVLVCLSVRLFVCLRDYLQRNKRI